MRKILILILGATISCPALTLGWDHNLGKDGIPVDNSGGMLTAAPCVMSFSNYTIGDLWFPTIYTVGFSLYTGYYPGSAGNMSIFQTGLWAGGYTGDGDGEPWAAIATFDRFDFLKYDTVCSGFKVSSPGNSSIDLESTFNTENSPRDLGMTVTLRYMMWNDPRIDDFIVMKISLGFKKKITDFWIGWMTDCDLGNNDLHDYYYDDMVGYNEQIGVAYIYDDDGDPVFPSDRKSKLLSPTYVGQILLSGPPTGGRINAAPTKSVSWETFSWWDWNNDVTGDASAYERLSSGTIKRYPPDVPFDYRMMTAVGPYDVEPGDTATFYMALVFGEGYDKAFWSSREKIGADVSDMGSLLEHVGALKSFFADDMRLADPAPHPPVLSQPKLEGRGVTISWECPSEEDSDFAGYKVYRSTVSNIGPWELIYDFDKPPYRHSCSDTVRIGFPTFYMVTGYDLGGNESTRGSSYCKTLHGVYATTVPSDFTGGCADSCESHCQGCPECYEECMNRCLSLISKSALSRVLVAPNPYRGSADWERLDYEGKIFFFNLPKTCTIWIYTVTGELVSVIYHNTPDDPTPDPEGSETGGEGWDMLTSNGQSIASGIYIYRVVSPEYGEKVGKFAIVKGQR
ncbi:MAG: hypothetical protein ACUVUU_01095 [bacterium]